MEPYSSVEKQVNAETEIGEKPAPYNWLAILVIVITYLVCALVF